MLAPRPDASSDDGVDLSPDHGQIAKNLEICVRGLDGRGHFWNVLISFQRRTPYKKNWKIPKFKGFNVWVLFLKKNSL